MIIASFYTISRPGHLTSVQVLAVEFRAHWNIYMLILGSALKKAGGEAFEDEVKNLAKDKSPLDVADGKRIV